MAEEGLLIHFLLTWSRNNRDAAKTQYVRFKILRVGCNGIITRYHISYVNILRIGVMKNTQEVCMYPLAYVLLNTTAYITDVRKYVYLHFDFLIHCANKKFQHVFLNQLPLPS